MRNMQNRRYKLAAVQSVIKLQFVVLLIFALAHISIIITKTKAQQQQPIVISFDIDRCLQCLCLASSQCSLAEAKCSASSMSQAPQSDGCGPFKLSFTYWADAGAPSPNSNKSRFDDEDDFLGSSSISFLASPHDFEKCALDFGCAQTAVKNRFLKYAIDCNNDNRIDCLDMAAMHRAGSAACSASWLQQTEFWQNFLSSGCYPGRAQRIFSAFNQNRNQNQNTNRNLNPINTNNNGVRRSVDSIGLLSAPSPTTRPPPETTILSHFTESLPLNGSTTSATTSISSSQTGATHSLPISRRADRSVSISTPLTTNSTPLAIDGACLECICDAQSGCDLSGRNCNSGSVCGPYAITTGYWLDAGSPGTDWLGCSRRRDCSEQAVRNYMGRYATDCDKDGRVTCADLAAIHHLGASACHTASDSRVRALNPFFGRFDRCAARLREPASTVLSRPLSTGHFRLLQPPQQPQPLQPPRPPFELPPIQPDAGIPQPARNSTIFRPVATGPTTSGSAVDDGWADEVPRPPLSLPPPPQPSLDDQVAPPVLLPSNNNNNNNNNGDLSDEIPRLPTSLDDTTGSLPTSNNNNALRPPRDTFMVADALSRPAPVDESALDDNDARLSSSNNGSIVAAECFECICEASTGCNPNSRCQSSDVRRTRCGLFLVSYDQWLESGLSAEFVTKDDLLIDPAADERAFYACVTQRQCAERVLSIVLPKKLTDCNKDGQLDCYDWAASHQAGAGRCSSAAFLESQYWTDFNACYGF